MLMATELDQALNKAKEIKEFLQKKKSGENRNE
jgi:hypothetical protein